MTEKMQQIEPYIIIIILDFSFFPLLPFLFFNFPILSPLPHFFGPLPRWTLFAKGLSLLKEAPLREKGLLGEDPPSASRRASLQSCSPRELLFGFARGSLCSVASCCHMIEAVCVTLSCNWRPHCILWGTNNKFLHWKPPSKFQRWSLQKEPLLDIIIPDS